MNPERWQKIRRICEDALEYDGGEREAFLVKTCAGDEELRKEVKSFLACGQGKDAFIEAPALEAAAQMVADEEARNEEPDLTGQTFLHYRITEKLGAGGMGLVYRAHDERLKRDVAVKVLPEIFAANPERLARLDREARLLASISHPNIAAIYGLEEHDGKRFLILELVEGPTLDERLNMGSLPVQEALQICLQLAEGLEGAHERGIIHRDLKPSNIVIARESKVKILDFGLGRALQGNGSEEDRSHSLAHNETMTSPGIVLGTAAYMSPEQAKGNTVDKRTDIWAFGCVLYECLTGRKAFQGDTITEVLASILKSEPDWEMLPADTPPFLRRVLRKCLQKDPSLRLHDISDARIEMLEEPAETEVGVSAWPQQWRGRWIAACATGAVLVFLAGLAVMKYFGSAISPTPLSVVRSSLRLGSGLWLDGWRLTAPAGLGHPTRTAMALSSDDLFIVYAAIKENPGAQDEPQIYLRRFDQLESRPITGTGGGISPFLSRDDRRVGFWAGGKIMTISVDGGTPSELCDASPYGFSWGDDDKIVFAKSADSGLSRIPAVGGDPEPLTKLAKPEFSHRLPHCLPGNRGILFTITRGELDLNPRVAVLNLATGQYHILLEDAADAHYVRSGHLAFLRRGTLWTVPFNPLTLRKTGRETASSITVCQALNCGNRAWDTGAGQFVVSSSGSLVYAPGSILPNSNDSLVWVDRKGNAKPVTPFTASFFSPRLSTDERLISYVTLDTAGQAFIYDLNRGTRWMLNPEGFGASWITWIPGGKRVFFDLDGKICRMAIDRSSSLEWLTSGAYSAYLSSCHPDGQTLAVVEVSDGAGGKVQGDVMLFNATNGQVKPFLNSAFDEAYPEFSPDGRWLAYTSNESLRSEVYVRPFPGPGGIQPISTEGGTQPLWARNGKQLFYRRSGKDGDTPDEVWAVDVLSGSALSFGKPYRLFKLPGTAAGYPVGCWDISRDGRFLMVKFEERQPQPLTEMIFVRNWFEELRRLAPR